MPPIALARLQDRVGALRDSCAAGGTPRRSPTGPPRRRGRRRALASSRWYACVSPYGLHERSGGVSAHASHGSRRARARRAAPSSTANGHQHGRTLAWRPGTRSPAAATCASSLTARSPARSRPDPGGRAAGALLAQLAAVGLRRGHRPRAARRAGAGVARRRAHRAFRGHRGGRPARARRTRPARSAPRLTRARRAADDGRRRRPGHRLGPLRRRRPGPHARASSASPRTATPTS